MEGLYIKIDKELKDEFRIILLTKDKKNMSEWIVGKIKEYVEENKPPQQ